ncbi:MAG TPA: hypothetical protein VMU01_04450 [Rhizomicrobium sp.]|nr:hypothetical protein [Rhizomicrobium sp.]
MHGRSIALCAVLFAWTATPGLPAERGAPLPLPPDPGIECDRALIAAQDIQALVPQGSVVVIGDVPISTHELKQRILWHVALARDEDAVWKNRTKMRILDSLRREALDDLAARRAEIMLSPSEIDAQIDDFLSSLGLTRHELQMSLDRTGVDMNTVRNVVAAQMIHARLNHIAIDRPPVAPANCLGM